MDKSMKQRRRTRSYNEEEKTMEIPRITIKPVKSKRSFLFYYFSLFSILCFVIVVYQVSYSTDYKANAVDKLAYNLGIHRNEYAVIIDAGSTGSRVTALSLYASGFDGSLKLVDDIFEQNKPGLSSFAENPAQGAKKIADLLEKAKQFIPKDSWERTPVAVRATAGLRLLPADRAEALLNEVRKVIESCPFQADDDAVSIMDGKDEGLFSWFTVNFLLDNLNEAQTKSVATIDLGGGSIQVTFIPKHYERFVGNTRKYLHPVSIMQNKIDLYSHSYLGLGLMAIRDEIFRAENRMNTTNIRSSCVLEGVNGKVWKYGANTYTISGIAKNEEDIRRCQKIARQVIEKQNVDKPPEIFEREVYVFSYFFDRAAESGMTDPENGGVTTIKEYLETAQDYCRKYEAGNELMCLDLTIIVTLLEQGFGLKLDTPLTLVDKIDNHEISWAIGAAYSILSDKHLPKV